MESNVVFSSSGVKGQGGREKKREAFQLKSR